MMSSKPIHLLVALATALMAACSRIESTEAGSGQNGTPAADSVARLLLGTWDLEKGCGGIAYNCHGADDLNEPGRYVFTANGRVRAYRATTLLFETSYSLTPGSSDENAEHRALLLIGAGPLVDPRPLRVTFQTANALLLDEGCCDRFEFEYRRR
jgi:hypothetical protein